MNLDERIKDIQRGIKASNNYGGYLDEPIPPSPDQLVKQLIREVVEYVKPERKGHNEFYERAIDEMEAKAKELGL